MRNKKGLTVIVTWALLAIIIALLIIILLLGKAGYIQIPFITSTFAIAPTTQLTCLQRGGNWIEGECAICAGINTRSEGWYNIDTNELIRWEQCSVLDCTDYHIANEYDNYFLVPTMRRIEENCLDGGGTWTAQNDELSCFVGAPTDVDCGGEPFLLTSTLLCESLGATAYCDNSIGFFGCLCKKAPPIIPAEDSEPQYTCGWTGSECLGTCPSSHPICDDIDWISGDIACACLTSDYSEVHPDWKPEGDLYNPHPEEEEEGYIQGQLGTIFVTDLSWSGASGGLDGIDEKCQTHATSLLYAGMSGTWIAIAGDTDTNARTRVSIDIPFYRIDGVIIANNHADLFDGSIQNPININEYGASESGTAWTGSDGAGYYVNGNCHDFNWVSAEGSYGDISSTSSSWLYHPSYADCSAGKHFYCVRVS